MFLYMKTIVMPVATELFTLSKAAFINRLCIQLKWEVFKIVWIED